MTIAIPDHILAIQPYVPGKPIEELQRELGLTDIVKLASNENPYGPGTRVLDAMRRALEDTWLYPDGSGHQLKRKLAAKLGVEPAQIIETLAKGWVGNMPPLGAALGTADDVKNVAQYVLSLSGGPHDSVRAALGKSKFGVCAACHGNDGKGNQAVGAPNLTDDNWLHGYGESVIVGMINNGKVNQMPAQADKLGPAQIQVLAAYVWSFSNKTAVAGK